MVSGVYPRGGRFLRLRPDRQQEASHRLQVFVRGTGVFLSQGPAAGTRPQAQTISLFADALPVYREQTGEKLDAEEKAQAFEIYKVLEQQRNALVTLIHATRPFLLELEHPLAGTAESLAAQVAAFQLMSLRLHPLDGR